MKQYIGSKCRLLGESIEVVFVLSRGEREGERERARERVRVSYGLETTMGINCSADNKEPQPLLCTAIRNYIYNKP
jgi:hypothetical protein